MQSQPAQVQLRDLSVGYRANRPVLGGLNVDVVPGEVLAVVGPNGSGKTTLFRTLLGVLAPTGGEATVSGLAPADYRRRHGVGYLAEDTTLPPGWTCDGILTLATAAAGPEADVDQARWLAGVDYATDVSADALSKGMKRRLALAVALMRPTRAAQGWSSNPKGGSQGRARVVEQPEGGFTRGFLEQEFLGLEGAVS